MIIGINGGEIQVNKNNSFTTSGVLTGSGTLTLIDNGGNGTPSTYVFNSTANDFTGGVVANNAILNVASFDDSTANNIVFNSTLFTAVANNNVGLKFGSGAVNALTLNNRAIEFNSGAAATASIVIQNNNSTHGISIAKDLVATGSGAKTLFLDAVAGPRNIFGGNITDGSDGGTVAITKAGNGTWVLAGSNNTFTGAITNTTSSTLSMNSISATGGTVTLGSSSNTGILEYTGSGHTTSRQFQIGPISSANGSGAILNNGTGALILSAATFNINDPTAGGSGGPRTLTLGGNYVGINANEIQGAILANTGAPTLRDINIIKSGTSTWSLAGANTYTGGNQTGNIINGGTLRGTQTSGTPFGTGAVTINAGILSLAPTGSGSNVTVTGGTKAAGTLFTYGASAQLSLDKGSQTSLTYTFGGTGNTTVRGTNGTLILSTSDIANFGTAGTKAERFIMNGTAPAQVNTLVSGVVIQDRNNGNAGDFAAYNGTD
ncbi:MAG TPA: autotransporter-associated beta strand repeat-containing protein, partial [Verrucomicrobiae bacterium]|nr:autotransporter-associated beta strand repeat-containing protein [Verrucomicrobiae bacterium]